MVKSSSSSNNVKKVLCDIEKVPEKELVLGTMVYWKTPLPKPTGEQEEAMKYTAPFFSDRPSIAGTIARAEAACKCTERDILNAHFEYLYGLNIDFSKPAQIIDFVKGDEDWQHYISLLCELKDGKFIKFNLLNIPKAIDEVERDDDGLKGSMADNKLIRLRQLASVVQVKVKEHCVVKKYFPWNERTRKKVDRVFKEMWPKLRGIVCDYKEGEEFTREQNASHNQFPKEAVRGGVLPMTRYMKRSLNVYAMALIRECMNHEDFDDDKVWTDSKLAKEMQTGAYSVYGEMSYVGDKKKIHEHRRK
tara:strand:- start:73 stop:987 length:915 start_codon:yes stop_codon:yes gene_type:complete